MDSLATLRALSDIIAQAVTTVERSYTDAGLSLPSLDEPFDPHAPAEALRQDPVVAGAVQNLVAAAGQIAAVMRDPAVSILNSAHAVSGGHFAPHAAFLLTNGLSWQFQLSSSVRAAAELNVAEILRDAGPEVRAQRVCRG